MASMFVQAVRGKVDEQGKVQLSDEMRAFWRRSLDRLRGEDIELAVRRYDAQRSPDQNEYLHAVAFPKLARHFGLSITDLKLSLMGECFGWKRDPITHREVPVKPHTSDMTKSECRHFIDWLLPWALQEHGVDIEPPTRRAPDPALPWT